jgi:hypothetical protein
MSARRREQWALALAQAKSEPAYQLITANYQPGIANE